MQITSLKHSSNLLLSWVIIGYERTWDTELFVNSFLSSNSLYIALYIIPDYLMPIFIIPHNFHNRFFL